MRGKKWNFLQKPKVSLEKSSSREKEELGHVGRVREEQGAPRARARRQLGTATAGRMSDNPNMSPEQQQERWLEEGKAVVKQQAFLMCVPAPQALAR